MVISVLLLGLSQTSETRVRKVKIDAEETNFSYKNLTVKGFNFSVKIFTKILTRICFQYLFSHFNLDKDYWLIIY